MIIKLNGEVVEESKKEPVAEDEDESLMFAAFKDAMLDIEVDKDLMYTNKTCRDNHALALLLIGKDLEKDSISCDSPTNIDNMNNQYMNWLKDNVKN